LKLINAIMAFTSDSRMLRAS